jgi:hypothetical protein
MFTRCCWRRKAADLHIRSICCTAGAAAVARRRRRRSLVTASRIAQDMPLLRGRPCILEYKQNKTLARSHSLSLSAPPPTNPSPAFPKEKKRKETKEAKISCGATVAKSIIVFGNGKNNSYSSSDSAVPAAAATIPATP